MPIATKKLPFVSKRLFTILPFICEKTPLIEIRKNIGFTIIELIVTLAVAAIVMVFGVPSFRVLMQNTHMTTQTNSLISDISLTRSEAIKHGGRAIMCSSSDGATCTNSGWNSGRLIFWQLPPFAGIAPAANTIVRYSDALPGSIISGVPNTFPDPLIIDKRGAPIDSIGNSLSGTVPMPIVFTLCQIDNIVRGRQISMGVSGQVTTSSFSC